MQAVLHLENGSLKRGPRILAKGIHMRIQAGELHALIGANGAGKSSLLQCIAGHPEYTLTEGHLYLNQQTIDTWSPDKRAQAGIFLAFQSPCEIEGVTVANFLRTALQFRTSDASPFNARTFYQTLYALLEQVGLPKDFTSRSVHSHFSGGEKKRLELLQLLLFKPKFALLDELDSGLDVSARTLVVQTIRELQPHTGFLIVSHATDLLQQLPLTHLYVLQNGTLTVQDPSKLAAAVAQIASNEAPSEAT